MAFFEGNKMTAGYGSGPDIINSCSINADRGEIVAILGPNGAGKSTAMKAMLGLLNLKSGSVLMDGKDISSLSPQGRVKAGISFVPQTRNVFADLTVRENLEVGAPTSKFSLTVKSANTFLVCGTNDIPALTLPCGDKLEISFPSIKTDPDFKFNNPNMAFIAVDLPAPLGPSIATISPLSAFIEHEFIMSGPLPYPAVILLPSKKAISFFLLALSFHDLNNFQ